MLNFHEQLIEEFYAGFAAHDAETMLSCYHEDIVFTDPVFGTLKGAEVAAMWRMLIDNSRGNLEIKFSEIKADSNSGSAFWKAKYNFSRTKRDVVNNIAAKFEFKDDLIVKHTDSFDFYEWSKQAFGMSGLLLGWTPFMKAAVRKKALANLKNYQSK